MAADALRPRSNKARRPFARKPCGRRCFCPWAALARRSQPAAGMFPPRRLAHSQNPRPQHPSQFSDRLWGARLTDVILAEERPEGTPWCHFDAPGVYGGVSNRQGEL